jgi:hypothetical protein
MATSIEEELVAFWDAWAVALAGNDAGQIGSFMSDDWIITGANGTSTKADFLGWVESGAVSHEAFGRVGEPLVRVYGDTAVMVVRVVNNGHYQGQPFSLDEWTSDVFLRRDGHWLCVASHLTAVQET